MVCDILLKIRDLGDVCGSFRKATKNHVYLSNAIITKIASISISSFKIEKKYITYATRITKPSFELFTDEQLSQVAMLNNPEYTQMISKIIEQRKAANKQSSTKQKTEQPKTIQPHSKQDKKDWNQFEENKKRFGVETGFEVDEYASPIDKNAPNFSQAQEKAKKYLRENAHNEASIKKTELKEASEDLMYSTVDTEDKWSKVLEDKKVVLTPEQIKIQDLNKQLQDVNKELENLQKSGNFGWSKIPSLVGKRNALTKEINNILNPIVEEVKPQVVEENAPKSKNESNESASKSKPNDGSRNTRKSEKNSESGQKKKSHQPEIPASFSSAAQIVECILKNIKGSGKSTDGWNSVTGLREAYSIHFKPLEVFDFPQDEIVSIKQKPTSFNNPKASK